MRQLQNSPITLPYLENFEDISINHYQTYQMGLESLDAWDFSPDAEGELDFMSENNNRSKRDLKLLFAFAL